MRTQEWRNPTCASIKFAQELPFATSSLYIYLFFSSIHADATIRTYNSTRCATYASVCHLFAESIPLVVYRFFWECNCLSWTGNNAQSTSLASIGVNYKGSFHFAHNIFFLSWSADECANILTSTSCILLIIHVLVVKCQNVVKHQAALSCRPIGIQLFWF